MLFERTRTLEGRDEQSASSKKRKCEDGSGEEQRGCGDDEGETAEETDTEVYSEPNNGSENDSDDSLEQIDFACTGIEDMWHILLTDLWKDEEDACEKALQHLVLILDSELDFAEKFACFIQLGGQFVVTSTLERWPDNVNIQEAGCSVFAILTNDETFVHDDKTLSVSCGLQFIISAMKRFPDECNIQRSGCCVISRCCCLGDLASFAVYDMECVGAVVAAMVRFGEDDLVQRWGCWSLCTLSRWKRCRSLIVEAGGFGLLAFVLGRDPASVTCDKMDRECLHRAARSALKRLTKQK